MKTPKVTNTGRKKRITRWKGETKIELMNREALKRIRAWKGKFG